MIQHVGTPHGVCHRHYKGQAARNTGPQAKVCDVVRFSFLVSSLTAKAAPCTRSDSQTVQKLPEEKKPVDGWMPKSSLGGLSSPEEEQ